MSPITISPLRPEGIMAVANLHAVELQYSFNSKMGVNHLACIYQAMSALPDSFIGVALDAGVPVGVVSGTLDVNTLKRAILQSLGWRGRFRMAGRVLLNPSAVFTLVSEMKPRPPVQVGKQEVNACLTAIAVATSHRRRGLASQLVTALEDFFRARGVLRYWLDTITENSGARSFYEKLGFSQVAQLGHTVVLLKTVNDIPESPIRGRGNHL